MAGFRPALRVDRHDVTPLLTAAADRDGRGRQRVRFGARWVNPVQIVRWQIISAAAEPAQYQNALGGTPLSPTTLDPNDLTSFDRSSTRRTTSYPRPPRSLPSTRSTSSSRSPSIAAQTARPSCQPSPSTTPRTRLGRRTSTQPPDQGPQRIRSVRARLVTRTAQADRTVNCRVTEPAARRPFLYRYCMNSTPSCATTTASCAGRARAR